MSKIIAALMSLVFAITGVGQSVIGFTEGTPIKATKREYKFDNDRLIIGGYYGRLEELEYAKDAGLDLIVAGKGNKEYLDKAQELGLGVIVNHYSGLNSFYGKLTDEQVGSWINNDYTKFIDHEAIWGVDLIDEPDAPAYGPIQKASKAFYDNTTGMMPYVNLFPNYANNEQLGEESGLNFIQKIFALISDHFSAPCDRYKRYTSDYINTIDNDYICVDFYPYGIGQNSKGETIINTNSDWFRNLDLLAEACRETDRDLWVITQSAGSIEDGMHWCEEKCEISQQMYASLAFGAKAVIHALFSQDGWWDHDSHMIGSDGKPTKTYYSVKAVNLEVKEFAEIYGDYEYTSTYMLHKSKCAGFNRGTLNCEVEDEKGNIKSSNGILIGTFTGDNNDKAYIVSNMEDLNDQVTATFTFTVDEGKTATMYQAGKTSTIESGAEITLAPGEGVFITVK